MKKILVILMMVLLCSTASMAQNRKRSAKKPKAKTERAMTEFEEQQKVEYLAYQLYSCKRYYKEGDIELAESCSRSYNETKSKNYYVRFGNATYSKKERAEYERLGIYLPYGTDFYVDGYVINVYFDHDGKADDIMSQFSGVYGYNDYNSYEDRRMWNDSKRMKLAKEKLFNQIDELSGYNAKASKREDKVKNFINQHSSDTKENNSRKDQEAQNSVSALERTRANNDACEKHKEEAYGKYYHSPKANTEGEKENVGEFKYTSTSTDYGSKYIFTEIDKKGNLLWGFVPEDRNRFRVHDREIMLEYLEKWWESETGTNGVMNTQKKGKKFRTVTIKFQHGKDLSFDVYFATKNDDKLTVHRYVLDDLKIDGLYMTLDKPSFPENE